MPPLRDRREDIAVLADHFWREATARIGSRAVLGAATTAALARYDWPGNVRELQNVLAALAVRTPRRGVVPPEALPPQFGEPRGAEACRLDDARRTFEERFVRAALVRTGGHRGRAADRARRHASGADEADDPPRHRRPARYDLINAITAWADLGVLTTVRVAASEPSEKFASRISSDGAMAIGQSDKR